MNDQLFPRRFTEASRPGTYLRIVVEGNVGAGDEIRVVERPDHDLTVGHVFRIYTRDRHEADRLLAVPQMSKSWRSWASMCLSAWSKTAVAFTSISPTVTVSVPLSLLDVMGSGL